MALLACVAFGAAGCFEIHEEIWVRDDGTVRYALDYALPEFALQAMAETDSAKSESALADFRHPAREVVEGDSTWGREYVVGDLHHFVSERQLASLERLVALARREDARQDSVLRASQALNREYAHRDSILNSTWREGPAGKAKRDSIMRAIAHQDSMRSQQSENTSGLVLGGYELQPAGHGLIRIRHVFRSGSRFGTYSKPDRTEMREFAGRTYTYRIHATRIVSTNGTKAPDQSSVEWSIPMASLGDSAVAMDAVIQVKR